jgi:23S rRNA pseudouridine2605 synthase
MGEPKDEDFTPLRRGLVIAGEKFQPMSVTLDRQQGANAWLTVGIREGRNREVRRAMESVGLVVNRLIRVSYGPFQLGDLKPGAVEEVRARVMRDQLGLGPAPENPGQRATKPQRGAARKPAARPGPRPATTPGGKPGPKPGGAPDPKPGPRPGGKPDPKPAGRPGTRPGPKPGPTPGPKPGPKPGKDKPPRR